MTLSIWIYYLEQPAGQGLSAHPADVVDLQRVPAVTCICVYAFMWHTGCVCIARDLQNPTPGRCAAVAVGSTTSLCIVYIIIAVGGYLSWGERVFHQNSIVDMYPEDDLMFIVVRLGLVIGLLICSIVNMYPLRESCVSLTKMLVPDYKLTRLGRVCWGFALTACVVIIAILFPEVVQIITTLGGTFATFLMVIFPLIIAKLVLSRVRWLISLVIGSLIAVFLIVAGLELIGKPS
jgi:hypothetical protein